MVCGQTYSRKVDVDCLNVLASLGASVHKVSHMSNLYLNTPICHLCYGISQDKVTQKKFCFQNILIINKLLYFNPGHRFLSCSCFVDLYRYKAIGQFQRTRGAIWERSNRSVTAAILCFTKNFPWITFTLNSFEWRIPTCTSFDIIQKINCIKFVHWKYVSDSFDFETKKSSLNEQVNIK